MPDDEYCRADMPRHLRRQGRLLLRRRAVARAGRIVLDIGRMNGHPFGASLVRQSDGLSLTTVKSEGKFFGEMLRYVGAVMHALGLPIAVGTAAIYCCCFWTERRPVFPAAHMPAQSSPAPSRTA